MKYIVRNKYLIGSVSLLVWSVVFLNACSTASIPMTRRTPKSTPVLTGGAIVVSRPDVYTGGRLINQRQRDIELLEEKMEAYESQGFQGLRDVRVMRLEPDQPADSEYAEKVAALEQEIAALKKQQQASAEIPATEAGGESETTPQEAAAEPETSSESVPTESSPNEAEDVVPDLLTPHDFVKTQAELSSIEKVRDEMAYRNMLNAEIKSKQRDERIMSMGLVEYGLRFDISVIPGMNTQNFGEAALVINWAESITPELFSRWRFNLQKELESLAFGLQRRWAAGSLTDTEKIELQEDASMLQQRIRESIDTDEAELEALKTRQSEIDIELAEAKNTISQLEADIANIDRQLADIPRKTTTLISRTNLEARKTGAQNNIADLELTITNLQKDLLDNQQEQNKLQNRLTYHNRRIDSVDRFASDLASDRNRLADDTQRVLCDILQEQLLSGVEGMVNFLPHSRVTIDDARAYFPQINQNPPEEIESQQFEIFKQALTDLNLEPYISSVHPKQYVQLISDTTARKDRTDLGPRNVAMTIYQGITRQPLAVGYKRGLNEFGWVLGPRLEVDPGGNVSERHLPVQYAFMVHIIVPAWLDAIRLAGKYYWLNADGSIGKGSDVWNGEINVNLPVNHQMITSALMKDVAPTNPIILPPWQTASGENRYFIREGQAASLMIRGFDLWRHPVVYLGTQKASHIEILPDLKGLVIQFDEIRIPPRPSGSANPLLDLRVITTRGEAVLKDAVEVLPAD